MHVDSTHSCGMHILVGVTGQSATALVGFTTLQKHFGLSAPCLITMVDVRRAERNDNFLDPVHSCVEGMLGVVRELKLGTISESEWVYNHGNDVRTVTIVVDRPAWPKNIQAAVKMLREAAEAEARAKQAKPVEAPEDPNADWQFEGPPVNAVDAAERALVRDAELQGRRQMAQEYRMAMGHGAAPMRNMWAADIQQLYGAQNDAFQRMVQVLDDAIIPGDVVQQPAPRAARNRNAAHRRELNRMHMVAREIEREQRVQNERMRNQQRIDNMRNVAVPRRRKV